MGTLLAWLSANVLPEFLKAMLGLGQAAVQDQQQRGDAVALGQAQQKVTDTGAVVDAQKRMDQAEATPTVTSEDLRDGRF